MGLSGGLRLYLLQEQIKSGSKPPKPNAPGKAALTKAGTRFPPTPPDPQDILDAADKAFDKAYADVIAPNMQTQKAF
jgi:hypothetical protein